MCRLFICYVCLLIVGLFINLIHSQKEQGDVDLGCPQSSYRFGNFCYIVSPIFVTYEDAEIICETGDGLLSPVKDAETQIFLNKLRIRKFLHRYWFGLDDKRTEGEWIFSDNSRLSGYSRWHRGEPNNVGNKQHCANMWLERHLEWDDEDCSKKLYYVCQYDGGNCTEDLPIFGRSCYEISRIIASYDEAQLDCQKKGGYLATIKTESTFNFIKAIIYKDRSWQNMTERQMQMILREQKNKVSWVIDTWIGVRYSNGEWINSDGAPVVYTNWAQGEPYNVKDQEDCVKLGSNWNDVQCDLRHGFICRYSAKEDIVASKFSADERVMGEDVQLSQYRNFVREGSQIRLGTAPFVISLLGCALLGGIFSILIFMGITLYKRFRNSNRFHEHQDLEILSETNASTEETS